jgi:Uncharacterized protein conserved in bacteria
MKKVLITILTALLVISGIIGVKYLTSVNDYKEKVANLNISNVDLTKIPDGTYNGSYGVTFVEAEVKVSVKEHKITKIDLVKHKNGKGAPAEVIPDRVVKAQSLDVDMVTGATSSSKVILKAIENALNSAAEAK